LDGTSAGKDRREYLSGIRKGVIGLAWPAMLEMTLHMSLWMVDTAMVGRLGAAALSATGLAGQVYWTVVFIVGSINAGTIALVSRAYGASDYQEACGTAGEALGLSFAGGFLTLIALRLISAYGPRFIAMDAEVQALAQTYMNAMSWGAVPVTMTIVANSVMRSTGNTRTPLVIAAVSNGFNIATDWLLIFGNLGFPRLEVRGAAVASAAAQFLGAVLALWAVRTANGALSFKPTPPTRWRRSKLRHLVALSVPAAVEVMLMDGARSAQMLIMAALGRTQFAAHQIAVTCESLSFMPGYGFAIASSVLVGQCLGARQPRKALDTAMQCLALAAGTMGAVGVFFVAVPVHLTRLFTPDASVVAQAASVLRLAGLFQPFIAANDTLAGALRGAGDTRSPMFVTAIGAWCIRIPLTYLVVRKMGLPLMAVWVINGLEWMVRAFIIGMIFQSGRWLALRGPHS